MKDSLRKPINLEGINTIASVIFLAWYLWSALYQVSANEMSITIASALMLMITLFTHTNLVISIFNRKKLIGVSVIVMYLGIYYVSEFAFEHYINIKFEIDPEYINRAAMVGGLWYAILICTFLWGFLLVLIGIFKVIDITPRCLCTTVCAVILATSLIAAYIFAQDLDNIVSIIVPFLFTTILIYVMYENFSGLRNNTRSATGTVFSFNKRILSGVSGYSLFSNGIALFCIGAFFLVQNTISSQYLVLLDSYLYRECTNYTANKLDDKTLDGKYIELFVKKNSRECIKFRMQFYPNFRILDDGENKALSGNFKESSYASISSKV
ncbi:MAG: hypothetical protein ACRDE7_00765 [Sphingobacterium sp.]